MVIANLCTETITAVKENYRFPVMRQLPYNLEVFPPPF